MSGVGHPTSDTAKSSSRASSSRSASKSLRASSIVVNAIDDLADTLTYSLESTPSGMTIDAGTGVIQWTPNNSQVASNPVTVRVEDQLSGIAPSKLRFALSEGS